MRTSRESSLIAFLPRLPVSLLGLAIAVSAAQAACSGAYDPQADPLERADGGLADAQVVDIDAPSEDSAADRADGMSYGDGYGKEDASDEDAPEGSSGR